MMVFFFRYFQLLFFHSFIPFQICKFRPLLLYTNCCYRCWKTDILRNQSWYAMPMGCKSLYIFDVHIIFFFIFCSFFISPFSLLSSRRRRHRYSLWLLSWYFWYIISIERETRSRIFLVIAWGFLDPLLLIISQRLCFFSRPILDPRFFISSWKVISIYKY